MPGVDSGQSRTTVGTRLSGIHPYPAMVADELAVQLAQKFVSRRSSVLDPFCGSGRLLTASVNAARLVGIDANPLAWLISVAKLGQPDVTVLKEFLASISARPPSARVKPRAFLEDRQVIWFSEEATLGLSQLISAINRRRFDQDTLHIVAVVLSATARESSYARRSGWKLHRASSLARQQRVSDPVHVFRRRLGKCISDLERHARKTRDAEIIRGSAIRALGALARESFDVILTSPPYGDSKTTVQYGAASELCLSVVRHLRGLGGLFEFGRTIDALCLGGRSPDTLEIERRYWAGGRKNPSYDRVARFLAEYAATVAAMAGTLRHGGRAVLIVGRRSSGGFRLKLDEFTVDAFAAHGFELEERFERDIQNKRLPTHVNRFARASDEAARDKGIVRTFDRDIVVVMKKTGRSAPPARRVVARS